MGTPPMERHSEETEPSVVAGVGRAIEAAQRLLAHRIDLARLDILELLRRLQFIGAAVVCGGLFVAIGWLAVTVAVTLALEGVLGLPMSAAASGVGNVALGVLIFIVALRKSRVTMPASNETKQTNGPES